MAYAMDDIDILLFLSLRWPEPYRMPVPALGTVLNRGGYWNDLSGLAER